ncbi:MAG: sirohydrochlorin cobaltochelatase [Desulfurivibrionaceae bacterium]
MASLEPALTKSTFFLIKSWDSFQLALRTCLKPRIKPEYRLRSSALILLSLAMACFALNPTSIQASGSQKKAVVLSVFGTSHESALPSILNIREEVRDVLPEDVPLKVAFTSSIIRGIWQERSQDPGYKEDHPDVPEDILNVKGSLASIADFQDRGYDYIIVQPTHFTSGEEFADLSSYVAGLNSIKTIKKRNMPFRKVLLGRPALGANGITHEYHKDIERVAEALAPDVKLAAEKDRALVYMAHGNEHYSIGGFYLEFEQVMRQRYPEVQTYVTTVEGFPGSDHLLERLAADEIDEVLLKPFMNVAGDHAKNDMAGEGPDSLKSVLENQGLDVEIKLEGLGLNDSFASIYAEHVRDAVHDEGLEF